jgi:hypothetical protein
LSTQAVVPAAIAAAEPGTTRLAGVTLTTTKPPPLAAAPAPEPATGAVMLAKDAPGSAAARLLICTAQQASRHLVVHRSLQLNELHGMLKYMYLCTTWYHVF